MIPILRFLFIGCLTVWTHIALAQDHNFEGIIKYVPLAPPGAPGDSIIVYYGNHKTRTSRTGTPAEQFGGVTEEITDFETFPNQTKLYYGMRGGDIQIIESKTSGFTE